MKWQNLFWSTRVLLSFSQSLCYSLDMENPPQAHESRAWSLVWLLGSDCFMKALILIEWTIGRWKMGETTGAIRAWAAFSMHFLPWCSALTHKMKKSRVNWDPGPRTHNRSSAYLLVKLTWRAHWIRSQGGWAPDTSSQVENLGPKAESGWQDLMLTHQATRETAQRILGWDG